MALLCLIKFESYDSVWGSEIIAPHILNLVRSCALVFTSWPLCPLGKEPSYALDRCRCVPKTGLSAVDKRKIFATARNRTTIPQSSSPQAWSLYRLAYVVTLIIENVLK
jgi:hypothetical protein